MVFENSVETFTIIVGQKDVMRSELWDYAVKRPKEGYTASGRGPPVQRLRQGRLGQKLIMSIDEISIHNDYVRR